MHSLSHGNLGNLNMRGKRSVSIRHIDTIIDHREKELHKAVQREVAEEIRTTSIRDAKRKIQG